MCRFVIVVFALVIGVYCNSAKEGESVDELVDSVRSPREFERDDRAMDNEKWRSVEHHNPENQDWIPADGPTQSSLPLDEEEPPLKRRRPGRKRKRRPQNQEYQNDENPYSDRMRPRPRRPQRLDQRREQWRDEMMSEEPFRPIRNYNRRRLYPKYDEESIQNEGEKDSRQGDEISETKQVQSSILDTEPIVEKIRDPYTASNQEQTSRRRPYTKRKYNRYADEANEDKEQTTDKVDAGSSSLNLKTLLKQNGGISLSELLQQKNLSLADLLKGERHAISALTEVPEQPADITPHSILDEEEEPMKRYNYNRRLPPSRKSSKQDEDENKYTTTSRPKLTVQNKRVSLFNNDKDTKYSEPVTEPVTERRIFVPSHPKYYTSVDYKPSIKELKIDKITETIVTTPAPEKISESVRIVSSTVSFSTSENPTTVKSIKKIHRTLPPTLAKLKSLTTKTTMKTIVNSETENYPKLPAVPAKAIKININELFGVNSTPLQTEGPMRISVNIEQLSETTDNEDDKENLVLTENFTESKESKQTEKYFIAKDTEKLRQLTAKDEIMEVLTDSMGRESLTKLLEARNMTLDELVEQRERGSSQRHLADIFHNQTKEPEPPEEMVIDEIIEPKKEFYDTPSLFDTFPAFDDQPYNSLQIKPSAQTKYFTSVVELPSKTRESRQNQFSGTDSDDYNYVNTPIVKTPTEKSHDILNKYMPIWRQAYTNLHRDKHENVIEDKMIIDDETHRIEEIENKLAEAVNDALNVELVSHKAYTNAYEEENEFLRLPYGVRSAIIASGVIIGISIVIFLTIFIIFKLAQRKRQRLAYCNSFSSSKIKSPILEQQYQSRLFGSIMDATLGRNKKISTISCSEPHSLQEYLWENDRKPFQ